MTLNLAYNATLMEKCKEAEEKGRNDEQKAVIIKMLQSHNPEQIHDLLGYPLEFVRKVQNEAE